MTRMGTPPRLAGLALLVAFGLGGCAVQPEKPKVKADAGGPDRSIAVLTDAAPGSRSDFAVSVSPRTFFRENSADLDNVAKETLDKQAAWLSRHPQWRVRIQGFADDSGTKEANLALSERRAEAVRGFLASVGVAPERMDVRGYGRERLVRDCPELYCKSQNRRVVTELEGSPGA
ncbi:OmpA family protein [Enterovirga rhinocerotis]|uniref:Peptidoglycan-associated lipoprotein n=1 Tax=Enterovirga rhinocerotis TaxID=1339210 RepID=A0A4R7C8R1_9HYPH|nr:OmpA family protein [Enterovirga rhinocerotis]TDR94653.1 peptidoglycan-associated lipoprotein [Enterovirga rhinocerotis]